MSNRKILKKLQQLENQSKIEKSKKIKIALEDRMLAITEDTGRFFSLFLSAIKARRVLEIGTSTGYSTLWFSLPILENRGTIITIEKNPSKISRAQNNFIKTGTSRFIKILEGEAVEVLKNIDKKKLFDFVFIDADKENLIKYFDLTLPLVRKGGVIAIDNVIYPTKYLPHIKRFRNHIKKTKSVEFVTLPIGNGEELIIKKY